ncbi:MAG: leucine-rich repeat domain-containing protein, partial [Candidatus Hermodarchaeota archaeon]
MFDVFMSLGVFISVFIVLVIALTYKMRPFREYWTLSERLAVVAFATMVASTLSFMTLLGMAILAQMSGNEISTAGQLLLGVLILVQLATLVVYPLVEFVTFSKEGKQATETYHRILESIIDKIAETKVPRILAGPIMYVIIFGGSGIVAYLILLALRDMHLGFTAVLFLFMLYPAIILGYYAAFGVYDAIRPVIYLQENYKIRLRDRETWKNIDNWLAILEFSRSFYGIVAVITGIAFVPFIKIALEGLINNYIMGWMPWIEGWRPVLVAIVYVVTLISTILVSLYFTVKGFLDDYWKTKPLVRLYDYIFTGYLISALGNLVFITLLTSHEEFQYLCSILTNQFEWMVVETNSRLLDVITNIQGYLIIGVVLFFVIGIRMGRKRQTKDLERYLENVGQEPIAIIDEKEKYTTSTTGAVKGWKELENIDLTGRKLNQIPTTILELKQIKKLKLGRNKLVRISSNIEKLENLEELDLAGNQLSSLPETFFQLTGLQTLNLRLNRFTSLPASIGNLKNLEWLSLWGNQLSSLPASIGDLVNLQTLYLERNQLSSLPESFGNLSSLQTLGLSNNQLSSLPETFGNLRNLKKLYLSNNELTSLPASIGNLVNLQKLELQVNQLTSLPETFFQLTNLQNLDLGGNKFTSLPETFFHLTNLQTLNLGANNFDSLPASIGNLKTLQNLDLRGNQLSSLPASIGNLVNLQKLYLINNRLTSLP